MYAKHKIQQHLEMTNTDDDAFTLTGLTVGSCSECGAQSTALTSTGRCLLCRRHGETMSSLEPSYSGSDHGSGSGRRRGRRTEAAPAPPAMLPDYDLESAGGSMPSPRSISLWSMGGSVRSLRSARSAKGGDNFASEDSAKGFPANDDGDDTDEESFAEIEIGSPTETAPPSGKRDGEAEEKGSCRRTLFASVMALGGVLLVAAIAIGVLASQGTMLGSAGRESNANSAVETDDISSSSSTTVAPSTTTTAAASTGVGTTGTTATTETSSSSTSTDKPTPSTTSTTTSTSTVQTVSTTASSTTPSTTTTTTPSSADPTSTVKITTPELEPSTSTAATAVSTTTPGATTTTSSTTTTTTATTTTTTTPATTETTETTTTTSRLGTTTSTTSSSTTSTTSSSTSTSTTEPGEYFPSEPVPASPPPGYFNYNTSDALYGPSAWGTLTPANGLLSTPEYVYWSQFQSSIKRDLTDNKCAIGTRQSPIDVRMDAIRGYRKEFDGSIRLPESGDDVDMDGDTDEYEEGVCYEHHEIRTSSGRHNIQSDVVRPQILPNKLRLVYDASIASSLGGNSTSTHLPGADFPHQWGGRIDLKHVDVHVPSQHKVEGKEFPAEYQLWHLHPKRKRAAVISVMVDVHPQDHTNHHFQRALVEWQKIWEINFHKCERRRTGEESTPSNGSAGNPFGSVLEEADEHAETRPDQRRLNSNRWNPYDKSEIMRSIHFYGYSGSLTEPPCTESFVEWHVMDAPMLVSEDQIRHLKYLLFLNRDGNCQRTSTHFEGRAARRPMREVVQGEHSVHRCTCHDFLSDEVRRSDLNVTRCTRKEEQDELVESLNAMA